MGFFLAFATAMIFNGIPSYTTFTQKEQDFILRSKWFWISVMIHGILGALAFAFLNWLEIGIGKTNSASEEVEIWDTKKYWWIYALFAGFSYSAIFSNVITLLFPKKEVDEKSIRSSIGAYNILLYNAIKNDVRNDARELSNQIVASIPNDLSISTLLERLTIQNIQKPESQAVGKVQDLITEIETLVPGTDNRILKLKRIVETYIEKVGKKVAESDFKDILNQ